MSTTATSTETTSNVDRIRQLVAEAEALGKQQAATAADAKALQKGLDDIEKEIAAYVTEHEKLAVDTATDQAKLKAITGRIKQHSGDLVNTVERTMTDYDKAIADRQTK